MADRNDEYERLRSAALQNAQGILKGSDHSEEDLRKQSEWLRVTLTSIGDGVISTNAEGQVTFMNGVAEGLTGWPLAEAAGRALPEIFAIVNERTGEPVDNPALRALREGRIVGLANHTILIARDGTKRPIDDSAAPMRSEAGQIVGAVLVFRDVTEQKRAEQVQAMLAAIVESSQDAIISKGIDGTIRSWNAAAERLFGYTAREAVGRPITMIIPADRQHEEGLIIERLLQGERVEHFETVRVTKSGQLVDISLTISPLRDDEGRIIGASKIARDITAQKQAEQERRRLLKEVEHERARLAEVFHRAPSFLAVLRGPDHVFELANPRYYELIGSRDIIGKPVREVLPEVVGQGFLELLDSVYQSNEAFDATDVSVTLQRDPNRPPEERVVEFTYQPLREKDGSVSGILVQGIDLTEQSQTQQTLISVTAESERRRRLYETILSNTPDLMSVFGLDYRILYANEALLRMWGRSWEESAGKTFLEIGYEPWHAEMHCREIDEVLATKRPFRGEVPFSGTHGRRIYDYIFVPVLDADGEVEAVAGATRDVTERRQMEDALREADRRKDEFLAMLAHELRNPLVPIRSGLDILAMDPGPHEHAIVLMQDQMVHIIRLVDDLLDVSRIMRGNVELRKEHVELATLIKRSVDAVKSGVENGRHHLKVSLPEQPIWLNVDPVRIVQVIENLLNNASKYMHPGGRIDLTAELQDGQAVISIRDTGLGIEPELLPHVFELFTQSSRSLDRAQGGLGIGLTLVQRLVHMHGGTVKAFSEGPDRGSTFTVGLPMADAPAHVAQVVAEPEHSQNRRIVVVDDNRSATWLISQLLMKMGEHEVFVADDGHSALEKISETCPEIVFLDIGLPGINGYEVCRSIRRNPKFKNVLMVALTGYGQEEDRLKSIEAGFDEHLVKPPSVAQIRAILAHSKLRVPS